GDGSGCGSGSVATTQDSFADEGVRATRASLAGEGSAGEGGSGCGSGSVATTQDSLADEGVRPTSGSFVGEGSASGDGSGCGSGSVATTQDSFADEGVRVHRAPSWARAWRARAPAPHSPHWQSRRGTRPHRR